MSTNNKESATTDDYEMGIERYAAYFARIKPALLAAKRYVAYSSDFGEAFRPLADPNFVRASYALAWGYVSYDVFRYTRHIRQLHQQQQQNNNDDLNIKTSEAFVKRLTFHSLASMGLPAVTIHSTVRVAVKAFGPPPPSTEWPSMPKMKLWGQRWGPTTAGLLVIPLLPYLFDHPVEYVVDNGYDWVFERFLYNNKK